MTNIRDAAADLISLLAESATAKGKVSPYVTQRDLMEALDVRSPHTMSDIVTRAAFMVADAGYLGCAIVHSTTYGYRLADEAHRAEIKSERTRLKRARTQVLRASKVMGVSNAGPQSKVAAQAVTASLTMLDMAIDALDEEVTA